MEIGELRKEIDSIDRELVKLFRARMDISAQVADYKRERNLPIFVPAREREILQQVAQMAGPEMAGYTRILYSTIFELSRSYQAKRNGSQTALFQEITRPSKIPPSFSPSRPWWPARGWRGPTPSWPVRKSSKAP